jgi:POT family proton-dependent oligopeptide transporter
MMLTQRFKPEDDRRESAFLWNYAGMNLGFFIGFWLPVTFSCGRLCRSVCFCDDRQFYGDCAGAVELEAAGRSEYAAVAGNARRTKKRLAVGLAVLFGLVPVIYFMLHKAELTGNLVLIISVCIGSSSPI